MAAHGRTTIRNRGNHMSKKILAGTAATAVTTIAALGVAAPAQAYPNDTPPGDTTPDSEVLGSSASTAASSGSLPNTGGPDTALLLGGLALLAVGGVALVGVRRRSNA